jgi:hypothetical protein
LPGRSLESVSRGGFKGGHRSRNEVVFGDATLSQDYSRVYPKAAKWVQRRSACGREGLRPDVPIDERFSRNLSRLLEPMHLDGSGLCEVCSGVVRSRES